MTKEDKEDIVEKVQKEDKKYNTWKIAALVMVMLFVVSTITGGFTAFVTGGGMTKEDASKKAVDYINDNLLQGQATAVATSAEEKNGMYNVKIDIAGMEYDSYVTKDGRLFFPTAIDMTVPLSTGTQETEPTLTCDDLIKTDAPVLQAFVISYCPYGLQMQRALTPVAEILGNNIKIRYIGSVENGKVTAMHGETEAEENLRQICIREEQADKYWNYIECFIKEGKSAECLNSTGADQAKLNTCMTDANKGIKYAQEDFMLQDQFGVTGSPTLIVNGESVSEFDFGGRSPEALKTLLCCSFSTQPDACGTTLSTAQVSIGLTPETSGTTGSGQC